MKAVCLALMLLLIVTTAHADAPGALAGKSMTLSPGHGLVWNGKEYGTQRPITCNGGLRAEDDRNLEHGAWLETYLKNDGMTVLTMRCTDKEYGNHPSGNPWWRMASVYWLEHKGYPCTVWGSLTDCEISSGESEWNDDVRARPLASNQDKTDIYISLHTNASSGHCEGTNCPTGSDMYYDCGRAHASWCEGSTILARTVNNAMIETIHHGIPMPEWKDRGAHDSNGRFGEIRVPERPAVLLELGFHDSCDTDVLNLKDNFFRCAAMWGLYKGVCDYFGVAPTWDFYSAELVSHTIPTSMKPGETKSVGVTFRNMGVLWNDERGFKLGALGGSDPFADALYQGVTSEVGPNGTVTFTFDLTAPDEPGFYASGWRMFREGGPWFGDMAVSAVRVR